MVKSRESLAANDIYFIHPLSTGIEQCRYISNLDLTLLLQSMSSIAPLDARDLLLLPHCGTPIGGFLLSLARMDTRQKGESDCDWAEENLRLCS